MQDKVSYYKSKVKDTYPDMTSLRVKEYENISNELLANIDDKDKCKKILHKLYSKLRAQFNYLAEVYSKLDLNPDLFEDALSSLYLVYMEIFNAKIEVGKWYPNYNSFVATTYSAINGLLQNLQTTYSSKPVVRDTYNYYGNSSTNIVGKTKRGVNLVELTKLSLFDEVIEDMVDDDTLEEIITLAEDKDLEDIINKHFLPSLSPNQYTVVCQFFGLNTSKTRLSIDDLAKKYGVSHQNINQILSRAIQKLRNYKKVRYIRDFMQ